MKVNCPQCGLLLDVSMAKLISCSSCSSSVLIENTATRLSDLKVLTDESEYLFKIGKEVQLNNEQYVPCGYSLYEYESGIRVEWELLDNENNTFYLNQEDENLFLVKAIPAIEQMMPVWESMQPNTHLKLGYDDWLVVEKCEPRFVGYRGVLLNIPISDHNLKCIFLSNTEGECLVLVVDSITGDSTRYKAFQGWWLDPMDIIF